MRVLHFFKTYWPDTSGGVEHVIHGIATGTARYGVESDVLSLSKEPEKNSIFLDGHSAHKAKLDFEFASTSFSRDAFAKFHTLAQKADIIHYHFPWPFMDMVHLWEKPKKPCVVTYHSDIVKQKALLNLYRPLMRAFLHRMNKIIVTSPNYLATSTQLEGFKDKTSVIPIGIAPESYPAINDQKKAYWRAQLPDRFFLFIGVLRYYKGLPTLLEAAQKTGYPIVIVGDGPLKAALKQQAELLKLQNCFFLGALPDDDKVTLLELCYAFAFPSHLRSEAFGVSLIEAAMFHKPMICCEIGTGTSFVNSDGVTGHVVPANDPESFAKAMTSLWEDPSQQQLFGEAAFHRYTEHFTLDRMARAYHDVYTELLTNTL